MMSLKSKMNAIVREHQIESVKLASFRTNHPYVVEVEIKNRNLEEMRRWLSDRKYQFEIFYSSLSPMAIVGFSDPNGAFEFKMVWG
ncbi:hypothetical protein [Bosea sp. TAF32]|uniref:hypothetical protein n=1 Tax=Bosea sp. TAF32 TaxID=3237482 RepID=UPI003F8DC19B